MMRVLAIVGALLLGLVGLGMSLCGGGILIVGISSSPGKELGNMIGICVPFILLGGLFVWLSVTILSKKSDRQDP